MHRTISIKSILFVLSITIIFIVTSLILLRSSYHTPVPMIFDGNRAFNDIQNQVNFGPRVLGSDAHERTSDMIVNILKEFGWKVELHKKNKNSVTITNISATIGDGNPWLLIGAHYDTRILADRDPIIEKQLLPVPGANDGASGVAVLLELARILPQYQENQRFSKISVVFFDAEDNGNIDGWDWIVGSTLYVSDLVTYPDNVIVVDMVGDRDLAIYQEGFSDEIMNSQIWSISESYGYQKYFRPWTKHTIIDDHLPFIRAGVPAALLIDFEYPYWHTTEDTIDKVSKDSLQIIGNILLSWILQNEIIQ
jgi:glutaminyl-peptide cyclotransferase